MGFLTCPPNLKSFSSISHCPCSLSVSFFHSESTIEPWSFWVFSTPFQSLFTLVTSQWEPCALYSFWAPNWCFSIFYTFKLLYTNITELNLSKHLPAGCFVKLSLKSFYFLYLLIYFILYNISYLFIHWPLVMLLFRDPSECGTIVTTRSYYIIWLDHCNLLYSLSFPLV